jgi:hypothetical protein
LGKVKPKLGLITGGKARFVLTDRCLEVDSAFRSLGIDLGYEQLVVNKVIRQECVWKSWEISPRIDFY